MPPARGGGYGYDRCHSQNYALLLNQVLLLNCCVAEAAIAHLCRGGYDRGYDRGYGGGYGGGYERCAML